MLLCLWGNSGGHEWVADQPAQASPRATPRPWANRPQLGRTLNGTRVWIAERWSDRLELAGRVVDGLALPCRKRFAFSLRVGMVDDFLHPQNIPRLVSCHNASSTES